MAAIRSLFLSIEEQIMSIFDKRESVKPFEYPKVLEFKNAMSQSYWTHEEFGFTEDIHDFKTKVSNEEREIIKRSMLMISQVEVSVKAYWKDLEQRFPKHEIGIVGTSFSESEDRHFLAYSHLLEVLGLNKEFENVYSIPAIRDRHEYLSKYKGFIEGGEKDFLKSLILFSSFIEYVSLFSQFFCIMSFNKYKNIFKDISAVVTATSKEEEIHGKFGFYLIDIIKKEKPDFWNSETRQFVLENFNKALNAEMKVLDYIFEEGETEFLTKELVAEFIKDRFNSVASFMGLDPIYELNRELLEKTEWYNLTNSCTIDADFFYVRPNTYSKHNKSITSNDLF